MIYRCAIRFYECEYPVSYLMIPGACRARLFARPNPQAPPPSGSRGALPSLGSGEMPNQAHPGPRSAGNPSSPTPRLVCFVYSAGSLRFPTTNGPRPPRAIVEVGAGYLLKYLRSRCAATTIMAGHERCPGLAYPPASRNIVDSSTKYLGRGGRGAVNYSGHRIWVLFSLNSSLLPDVIIHRQGASSRYHSRLLCITAHTQGLLCKCGT